MVLNTRAALNDATARRLARSYQRAKPARLVETATGGFLTRPFVRDDTWLVAVAYQPSDRRSGDRSAHTTSADARGVETSGYSCVTGVVAGNAVSGTLDRGGDAIRVRVGRYVLVISDDALVVAGRQHRYRHAEPPGSRPRCTCDRR
ncbi:MAG TPA: hypothetical protein VFE45_13310 [Coriobacteriia bacterium]|jgi:hypothetical protein|nr:hypothetical protein [Coriobacteriia bacterium]